MTELQREIVHLKTPGFAARVHCVVMRLLCYFCDRLYATVSGVLVLPAK